MEKVKQLSQFSNLQRKKEFFYKIKEIILRSRLMQHRSPFAPKNALEMQ